MSIITDQTIHNGITLSTGGSYTSPLTITSSGAVEPNSGTVGIFGSSTQAWTVENHGTVTAPGKSSTGIDLRDGGYVSNAGLISAAYAAIRIAGGIGTVKNSGTLQSTGVTVMYKGRTGVIGEGITLASGGTIDNTGLILSANGIYFESGNGTLTNAGTIIGTGFFDPHLDPGAAVYFKVATPGIVFNSGTIRQYADIENFAVELQNGGTVINYSGGLIEAITGVKLNTYTYQNAKFGETNTNIAIVSNAGIISGTAGTAGTYVSIAVNLGNGGLVDNQATGLIRAGLGIYVGILSVQHKGTPGIVGTVTNAGTITGSVSYGVEFLIGGTVINYLGGLIKANTPVYVKGTTGAVTNAGTLLGSAGIGVEFAAGGKVDNQTGGLIEGKSGVKIVGTTGTVSNAGTILGTGGTAVYLGFGGTVSNMAGLIKGAVGVEIGGSIETVINAGTILGTAGVGVTLVAGGTVIDSGTIGGSGGTAISFGGAGSDLLVLQHGYKLTGGVAGSVSATDTLELAGSLGAGVTANLSTLSLSSFEDILFGAGGYNTLKITNSSGTFGMTISGFDQTSEIIDLTAIGNNGTIKQNDTVTHRLTISGSGGTVTLQLDFSDSSNFTTMSDGAGGTDISVACFCRGTLILTDRGEVPVEALSIGARVVTRDGATKPVKWIGRRNYTGWLAAGTPRVLPICCKPGSLADGVPKRELWVSPEHALYLGGVLVPAELLVNGSSIVKAAAIEEVHYYHLELEAHDLILAEGAWAESFVDDDSRRMFHNAAEYRELYPEAVPPGEARYCAPRLEEGVELERLRCRLADRAGRLLADGRAPERAAPAADGSAAAPLGELLGHLDQVEQRRIRGWAQDSGEPERPVGLVVTANGRAISRVLANRYRADLKGLNSGRHGFDLVLAAPLSALEVQEVRVRREADGAELPGSPMVLPMVSPLAAAERALAATLAQLAEGDEERALALLTGEADRLLARRAARDGGSAAREALRLFRRRWGAAAGPAAEPVAEDGLRALVIDAPVPRAGHNAGAAAILSHLRALQELGYAVSFAAAEGMHDSEGLQRLAEAEGVLVCGAPYYSCVEDVLARQAGSFELIYMHRAPIADRYLSLARRYCPKARILYSLADLHHLRLARQAQIEQRPELLAYSRHLAAVESAAARRADIVLTHSPVEAALLRAVVDPAPGATKVHVVPFAVPPRRPRPPFAGRHGVAFIGGLGHAPNGDAVHHLVRDVLPLVWAVEPAIRCKIVGDGWQADRMPQFDPRVELVGAVADLDEVFDTIRLTVAPLRFGAGIKGKVLDSFAAGLPCVMTPVAAEGLPLSGTLAQLVGDDAAALAATILRLHGDVAANSEIAAAARLIADQFCQKNVTAALAAALSHDPHATATPAPEPQLRPRLPSTA